MHYYTHNIGEFALETRGLSYEEIGVYVTLLDRYASTQKPITKSWVALAYKGESNCLALALLDALFVPSEDGWTHPRVDELIKSYEETSEKRRAAGAKGGRGRRSAAIAHVCSSEGKQVADAVEQVQSNCLASAVITNNHKPINQEPIDIERADALSAQAQAPASTPARRRKTSGVSSVEKPDDIPAQVWSDWLQIRKAKRLPLTKTAWDAMLVEAEKVGYSAEEMVRCCVERGWASFKAQWLINEREKNERAAGMPPKANRPLQRQDLEDLEEVPL